MTTVRSPQSLRRSSRPTTASSVLPPSSTAAPTQPTLPSRAPRQRAALRRSVGRRTTSATSWTKPPVEAGEREDRKEAAPEEVGQPGSGGVKANVRDEWAESQEERR